jgi:hypothetical protein
VQTRIQQGEIDSWSYIWGSGQFSSQKAYKVMMANPTPLLMDLEFIMSSKAQVLFLVAST